MLKVLPRMLPKKSLTSNYYIDRCCYYNLKKRPKHYNASVGTSQGMQGKI